MNRLQKKYMQMAIDLSRQGMEAGEGGPFGCVIVKDGEVVGKGYNTVASTHDPTAHAEIIAIRDACERLQSSRLEGCELYTSCEPCPMCIGAIYWARPEKIFFANDKKEAAEAGFDDDFIYKEIELPIEERQIPMVQMQLEDARKVFQEWLNKEDKPLY